MCLALANASIPLYSMFCCVPVSVDNGNVVYVTKCNNAPDPLSIYFQDGSITEKNLQEAYEKSSEKSSQLFEVFRTKFKNFYELNKN